MNLAEAGRHSQETAGVAETSPAVFQVNLDTARDACPIWLVGRGKEKESLLTFLDLALWE